MSTIKARPTVYKGIKMRSRLEADFAQRYLDGACAGASLPCGDFSWEYEPQCFASDQGQYLPDFRSAVGAHVTYMEVKPRSLAMKNEQDIDALLDKMEIIWESEPHVLLFMFFWKYGGVGSYVFYTVNSRCRIWYVTDFPVGGSAAIWRGHGQHEALVQARLAET